MNKELKIDKTISPGETVAGVQICPFGNFTGEKNMQVCDRKGFDQVIADWKANGSKEILMDFEHKSEVERIDSDTKAAAWITNLRVDDTLGLLGDLRFTDKGAEAVTNRRLRFLSVTWYTDNDGRPTHMTSVALTNKPNIPVEPILNKSSEVKKCSGGVVLPNLSTTTPLHHNTTNQTKGPEMDIEKLKQALGLPAEATEEQVLAAIKEGQDAKAKAEEMQAEAEKKALECEANEFAEANAKKCNKDVLKAQYIANKEVAKALVAGIPDAPAKAEEPQKILNKGIAPQDADNLDLQRNKALGDYRSAHPGCDFSTAWSACRANSPELFAD